MPKTFDGVYVKDLKTEVLVMEYHYMSVGVVLLFKMIYLIYLLVKGNDSLPTRCYRFL